ncbi:tudor domain containing 1 [Elasticomyces elasticus]|nr:tudor domain containing 1 [Elasticomyces elasticus]KAK4921298.1 tudor domain containing 1 [Elasticomyces elasticus]KAK5759689.1 tudor domain containing 1 [Elasticomyces elasticus]
MADAVKELGSGTIKATVNKLCSVCGASSKPDGGVLQRCGQCKVVTYCSADCQKQDWPAHKILCKSILQASRRRDNGCVRKVLPARYQELTDMFSAFAITLEENGKGYQTSIAACNIGDKHGSHPLFIELLISRVLGFPLGVSRHPQMGSPVPNTVAEMLSVDPDHESSTFGQPLKQPGATGTGGLIVARRDGRQLHFFHVSAFVNYVSIIAIELGTVKQREKAGEIVDRQEIKNRLLTPAAFEEGFRRFKEKQMVLVSEQERKVLEKVECPV